jgi:hypothetical protein
MKMYQIKYRKDDWVSVIAGFADDIDIRDIDIKELAKEAVIDECLTRYETLDSYLISEYSIEVNEVGEGTPDVVIGADCSVVCGDKYERLRSLYSEGCSEGNPGQ